jgi:hypothetical protein
MRTSHRRTSRRRAATRTRAKRSFLKKTFFFLSHFYIWSSLHLDIFLHRPLEYPYDTCLRREDQGGPLFPFYIEKVLWGKNGDAGATNSRPMPVVVLLALNKVPHQSAPPILIDGLGRQKKGPLFLYCPQVSWRMQSNNEFSLHFSHSQNFQTGSPDLKLHFG